MKILLLEDEVMLQGAVSEYLQMHNHRVDAFVDGAEALEAIMKGGYDLLILDINVPSIDGLSLLEQLNAAKLAVPAIFTSAQTDIAEISKAYELGCFDYLKKPFHLQELLLHINRVMRDVPPEQRKHLRLSKRYSYDMLNETLLFDNVPQTLTRRQHQIIDLLARNMNRVVDFETFRIYVWDEAIIDNATIRAEVNRLKKALKEDFIQNIRAMGYMIDGSLK
ncbi:response regulator transcription factor [Sulfurimonas sp. HSL-1656]|uniref:response regulator transcription factor n=1 Tax=Thiomicrolovo subterrani TaxID=3131934 RepID=UPI0031F9BEA3